MTTPMTSDPEDRFGMAALAAVMTIALGLGAFFAACAVLHSLFVPWDRPRSQPWAAAVVAGVRCTFDQSTCADPCGGEEERDVRY